MSNISSQPYVNPYFRPSVNQPKSYNVSKKYESIPSVLVIEQIKNEVPLDSFGEERPEVPFAAQFFLVNHDPRLHLSSDTYVQMIMGAGLKVRIKQKGLNKKIAKWLDVINFEQKLEDGLYSYVETGNLIFEKAPKFAQISEVDLATVTFAKREPDGKVKGFIQEVNMKENFIAKENTLHFKLTNVRKEVWGRGLYHSLFASKNVDGIQMDSPIVSQWKMEDAMVNIFESYASPMMMIHFKDAGEQWIKQQETAFKKMKQGAKILTDKEFDAKIFEVNPQAKFDKYVEHRETNLIEPGSQFPLGFFNADFTNRNAAEITDSVMGRKIKRIQKRLAAQIKEEFILAYIREMGMDVDPEDVTVQFEIESKSEVGEAELLSMFEKGVISRSEYRKHISKKTTVELDENDMADTPPITSVTPTNDLRTTQPSPAAQGVDPIQQQAQLAQLQQQVENLTEVVKQKVPAPRGRPKKTEIIGTMPEIRTLEDLKARIRVNHPGISEEDLEQIVKIMEPVFFSSDERID